MLYQGFQGFLRKGMTLARAQLCAAEADPKEQTAEGSLPPMLPREGPLVPP